MDAGAFVVGLGLGGLVSALTAWYVLTRYVRDVRAAERRARNAERLAEIGAMTGGLAHEIKNPLSTIGLNAQLLVESLADLDIESDTRRRLITRAETLGRETERLREILAEFLEFAGQFHLDLHPADIDALVEELVDFYSPEAERFGVRIMVHPGAGDRPVQLDRRLVKQALLNLMINATQAMSGHREDGREEDARELIIRTERGRDAGVGEVVRVHVIDTGPGIDNATAEKVFEPYFTTKKGGSGLGLPVTRRICEEHGGRIEIVSTRGKGSDFVVTLPLEPRTA